MRHRRFVCLVVQVLIMRRRLVALGLGIAWLASFGCGASPPSQPTVAKPPVAPKQSPPEIKPVEVRPDEFPSIEAAFAELEKALALPDGNEQNRAVLRCQKWLALQQDKAVPITAEHASDPRQPLGMRLTACRILGLLGPAAVEPLLELADHADSTQLRRKAIETVSRMKPPAPKTIEKLIALLDDADSQIQWQVIEGLRQMGEPAKAAAAKLSQLRQEHAEEQIRVSAGEALKKVAPRKTFAD
jgi:HEAT repeat protein